MVFLLQQLLGHLQQVTRTVLTNSSLAQIADYAGGSTTITGGEVTGGFLSQGTDRQDLTLLRDLGNCNYGWGNNFGKSADLP
jgi:hypothetical protein